MAGVRPRAAGAVRATLLSSLFLGALLVAACTRPPPPELARDELFTLSIGPLDEQIDLFRIAGTPARHATSISMRDGLFYIANGNARKVMQLSSYGDLLLLIYDPRTNPAPVGFAPAGGAGAATRIAVPYAFNDLSHIAVDGRRRILVVDALPGQEHGQVVQRFSRRGEHLDVIGREGIGGAPFPRVQRLTVTATDGLVVTARSPQQWLGFWYDADGELLDQVEFPHAGRVGDEEGLVIWEVIPQLEQRRLLLFVDAIAADGGTAGARDVPGARLYDLASRSVIARFPLPANGSRRVGRGGGGQELAGPAYYPLGVTAGGHLFLTRREDEQSHSLVVLGRGGRVVTRRQFGLDEAGLRFVSLGMNASGVLYGLLGEADGARMVWWRGDLLVAQAAPRR